ncbi:glycosyltransferase family 4 protein [Massilia glaciei]|uniref:Transferase n=1 Tax=Massilia glaciei TaxID=1524097 RepID=A0A2U2HC20_9BURK|nr:glycosyltransferase family 4 protein [Massilia glaciei]PWF40439.1 transferase [Massilia glaciei]
MRILIVHNAYQHKGGEDSVVEAEIALLRARGHALALFTRHNDAIGSMSKARLAAQTIWSGRSADDFARCLRSFRPDVVHVHNVFPLISPSIYWVARRHKLALVQTLHNFRLLCPQAMLLREGRVCEDCVGAAPWRAVVHACYRDSRAQSAVVALMLGAHRLAGTWRNKVTRYIALNDFGRDKFIEGGFPAARIVVKPHFVDLPAPPAPAPERAGFLFAGRLSPEKGLAVLAAAAAASGAVVRVAGAGPAAALVDAQANLLPMGHLEPDALRHHMRGALALLVPSICNETFGLVIIEAFACGLPVIASRIGGFPDLVREGETGLLFAPGDSAGLARAMDWAARHPAAMARMGERARLCYEARYGPEQNYAALMAIYACAIAQCEGGNRHA